MKFPFFNSPSPKVLSGEQLQVDMHAHWLPGIDDGSPDMAHSLDLIRGMVELGYRKLIATPHIIQDIYPNTREIILEKLSDVRLAAQEAGLEIELEAAAEYLLDDAFERRLEEEPLLSFGDRYVLVELSFYSPYPRWKEVIFAMQLQGYKPILAHPERYPYWNAGDMETVRNTGCTLQLNCLSLDGYYGRPVKEKARKLLDLQWIDWLGTDMHHSRHLERLRQMGTDPKWEKLLRLQKWNNHDL